jgi:Protein of unknown function (DUF3828)
MLTRRNIVLGAFPVAFVGAASTVIASPAAASDQSAHDFVAAIYDTYVGKGGNGVALDNDRTVRRYFEPSLAASILKDQKDSAHRNEVGALDFDPFVDAQDWEIAAFAISVSEAGTDKVSATVKFTNFDKPSTVVLDLVKIKNDWKISNITWMPHDKPNNLRALYTQ